MTRWASKEDWTRQYSRLWAVTFLADHNISSRKIFVWFWALFLNKGHCKINKTVIKRLCELLIAFKTHKRAQRVFVKPSGLSLSKNAVICEFDERPRQPSQRNIKSSCQCSISHNLVEATRVELVSENLSVQLSTSVVYLLKFLKLTADKQAVSISSSWYIHTVRNNTEERSPLIDALAFAVVLKRRTVADLGCYL